MIKITKKDVSSFFKKTLVYLKAAKLELIIIAAAIFLDLLSKFLITSFMDLHQSIALIPNFLYFTYVKNPVASFNFSFFGLDNLIGQEGLRWFFVVFVSTTTCVFIVFMITGLKNRKLYRISLALIIGGAIGNLYDRIFHAAVRDFIEFYYFGKTIFGWNSFPIFNIADSSLVIGVTLFIIYFIFYFSKDEKAKEEAKKAKIAAIAAENKNETADENSNAEVSGLSDSEAANTSSKDDESTVYAEVGPFFKKKTTSAPPKITHDTKNGD